MQTSAELYLGAAIINNEILLKFPVKPHFFTGKEKELHTKMIELTAAGREADLYTLAKAFEKSSLITYSWLSSLTDTIPSMGLIKRYVEEITANYKQKSLINILDRTKQIAQEDTQKAIESLEHDLLSLFDCDQSQPFVSIQEAAKKWSEDLFDEKGENLKVITGDQALDENLILDNGGLHIIAGRPGMGKTSFALWILEQLAKLNTGVLFFSLEMTTAQIVTKLMSQWTQIPQIDLTTNYAFHLTRINNAYQKVGNTPIYISDLAAQTIERISMVSQFAKKYKNIGCVIVDYLQLVRLAQKTNNREQDVAFISSSLKNLAKNLNIPVIALSQLNRITEASADKRPALSHLRESGSLEQDADTVSLLYRPEYYLAMEGKEVTEDQKGLININIAKQRKIGPRTILGRWKHELNTFTFGEEIFQPKKQTKKTKPNYYERNED
jgi:replicative DNA helicase